jgi:hypothetical protein
VDYLSKFVCFKVSSGGKGSVASLTSLATFQNIINRIAKKLIIEQILNGEFSGCRL